MHCTATWPIMQNWFNNLFLAFAILEHTPKFGSMFYDEAGEVYILWYKQGEHSGIYIGLSVYDKQQLRYLPLRLGWRSSWLVHCTAL